MILERLLTWGRGGLCRAGLHLQLTTELITAGAAAGAEGAAAESMWQRSGALAVVGATAWAGELLAALSGCGLGRPSGEATTRPHPQCPRSLQGSAVRTHAGSLHAAHAGWMGLYMHLVACLHMSLRLKDVKGSRTLRLPRLRQRRQRVVMPSTGLSGQPGERQPRRKKVKGTPPAGNVCSLPGLAHAALGAVLCTLGACTDAAWLGALSGESCEAAGAGQLQHESSAVLAVTMLRWTMQLPEDALSGIADSCW